MDKILIFTESVVGHGHYSAADSLKKALELKSANLSVEIVRVLPLISKPLEAWMGKLYLGTLRYAPLLWEKAYTREKEFGRLLRDPIGRFVAGKLKDLIEEERPKVAVCTHSFCLGALAQLKARTGVSFRLGSVITDFDIHSFWLHPSVDFYIVANEETAAKLYTDSGNSDCFATGIPIDPAFSHPPCDKKTIRRKLGLDSGRFTVLFTGGGCGMIPLSDSFFLYHALVNHLPVQLVFITGNNDALHRQLSSCFANESHVHVRGFVHNMVEYMQASDLILTKPGGLTSSEAMAAGLPMLIGKPIPGHEEKNSHFLLKHKVAIRRDHPEELFQTLLSLLEEPHALDEMRQRALRIGKPRSAFDGAEAVLQYLH
jgi:processive 1,2-diacylglycerol beta-glucosyltransferase